MSIRVVLGEDNVLVREGVRALLDSYDDIEVVGVAEDAPSLLSAAAEHVPDVVVTDIKMPPNFQLEGIDCAHAIREKHPGTGVVVLSAHDDEAYAIALLGKGQSGLAYLLKDRIAQGDELVRAIREVAAGGTAVDPAIAERLSGRRETAEHDRELLDLMSQGLGYEQMAERLGTTQEAVDRRVTELFTKMAAGARSGGASAVDDMKRLHAAVVAKQAAAATLSSYVPQRVAEKLARGEVEREELEVTVLFSDIRGFSAMAERLAANEIAEIVGRHLSAMAEIVVEHLGMIDKFQGDAVMVVFGAPDPIDDHAERALRCAIAMQRRQARAQRRGMGHRRRGRPAHRGWREHRAGDRRRDRRRRPARVHGDRRRGERGPAVAERGGGRRDRGELDHDRLGAGDLVRADRLATGEGPGGAGRGLPRPGRRARGRAVTETARHARWPWFALGVFLSLAVVGLILVAVNGESLAEQIPYVIAFTLFGVVGALLLSRMRGNRIGGLLLYGAAITGASFAASELATYLADRGHLDSPVVIAASLISSIGWLMGIFPVILFLPLLFPDGHLPSRRWLPFAWLCVAVLVFLGLSLVLGEKSLYGSGDNAIVANPFYVPAIGRLDDLRCSVRPLAHRPARGQRHIVGAAVPAVRRASNGSRSSGSRSRSRSSWPPSSSRRSPARSGSTRT